MRVQDCNVSSSTETGINDKGMARLLLSRDAKC